HARRRADRPVELLPIDFPSASRIALHVSREIDGPQVAGFVRQERLFPALSHDDSVTTHRMRHCLGEIVDLAFTHVLLGNEKVFPVRGPEPSEPYGSKLSLLVIQETNCLGKTMPTLTEDGEFEQDSVRTVGSSRPVLSCVSKCRGSRRPAPFESLGFYSQIQQKKLH